MHGRLEQEVQHMIKNKPVSKGENLFTAQKYISNLYLYLLMKRHLREVLNHVFGKVMLCVWFCLLQLVSLSQPVSISGIVNRYYSVKSVVKDRCDAYIELDNVVGLAIGDKVMIYQHAGARYDTTNTTEFGRIRQFYNSGNYEWASISAINGNVIKLQSFLKQYYDIASGVQLIKVATYSDARVTGTLTSQAWNGITGGVLAIEVTDTLELLADIDVSGTGYRGGIPYPNYPSCSENFFVRSNNLGIWAKGEGLMVRSSTNEHGRGAAVNGGGAGGSLNAGGGGGGNAGQGGNGGSQAESCPFFFNGGNGGWAFDYLPDHEKAFMGGGGGAGHQDESRASSGSSGGGIIVLRSRYVKANAHAIKADGANVISIAGDGIFGDGAGGGGAGGSILLECSAYLDTCVVSAVGGNGGNTFANNISICFAPGGGGGGGIVRHNGSSLPASVKISSSGGKAGLVSNALAGCDGTPKDASDGVDGYVVPAYTIPEVNHPLPQISYVSPDTFMCKDDSIMLVALFNGGPYSVTWTGNGMRQINNNRVLISPPSSGEVWIQIMDSIGCVDRDTISIRVNALPDPGIADEFIILLGDSVIVTVSTGDSIFWSPTKGVNDINALDAVFKPVVTTLYRYYITDSNRCQYRDSLLIRVKQCSNLNMPNIFTPNGDGKNDEYHIDLVYIDAFDKIEIYNRWGEKVFESTDRAFRWDGTWKGVLLPTDVYTYFLKIRCDNVEIQHTGDITLLR